MTDTTRETGQPWKELPSAPPRTAPSTKAHCRLVALQRHLTPLPAAAPSARDELASDPAWAGKVVWLICALPVGTDVHALLPSLQTVRVVFAGYGRTVVGAEAFGGVLIVEAKSPSSYAIEALLLLLHALPGAGSLVVACRPGWWRLGETVPAPTRKIERFSEARAAAVPSGLVGEHVAGARVGVTSGTTAQASALVADGRIGDSAPVWHLNLLRFGGEKGMASYRLYQRAMGVKGGILSQFGARSTLANKCFPRALLQPHGASAAVAGSGFDMAIFACYPSKHAYFSMSASEEYRASAHLRHQGLAETYIISCLPELVVGDPGSANEGGSTPGKLHSHTICT